MNEDVRKRLLGPEDTIEQSEQSRILDPQSAIEDELLGASLRPRRFEEYVGQANVVENLRIAIDAANKRDEPLEHVLFYGPPGLGKTTLAALIAREMGVSLRPTSGPTLDKPKDLVGILTSLEHGDILFIDEMHRLGRIVEEFLYPAMEDFQIDFIVDRGAYAKTLKLPLKRFTLVGATTRAGMLSAPLRDRFGIVHHLDYYENGDLEKIVARSAGVLEVPIDAGGCSAIAARSRGTPRIANRLLRRVRDYAQVRGDGRISAALAEEALGREGVDAGGLDRLDRAYLRALIGQYRGGPAGIAAIAATLTQDAETLEDVVEPFLLKSGLIIRTGAGRKATAAGYAAIGENAPAGEPERFL